MTADLCTFTTLAKRYRPLVLKVARTLAVDDADAAEIAEESLVNAGRGFGSLPPAAHVWAWLYRVTVNTALLRGRRRAPALSGARTDGSCRPG